MPFRVGDDQRMKIVVGFHVALKFPLEIRIDLSQPLPASIGRRDSNLMV
jgi:hypothetical protein